MAASQAEPAVTSSTPPGSSIKDPLTIVGTWKEAPASPLIKRSGAEIELAGLASRYHELLSQGRLDTISQELWTADVEMRWACRPTVRGLENVIADVAAHMGSAVPEHVEFERPLVGENGFAMRVNTVNRLRGSGHLFRTERLWFQGVREKQVNLMQEFIGGVALLWEPEASDGPERVTVGGVAYRPQALSVAESIGWIGMHGL
jgi:hypothetical protein